MIIVFWNEYHLSLFDHLFAYFFLSFFLFQWHDCRTFSLAWIKNHLLGLQQINIWPWWANDVAFPLLQESYYRQRQDNFIKDWIQEREREREREREEGRKKLLQIGIKLGKFPNQLGGPCVRERYSYKSRPIIHSRSRKTDAETAWTNIGNDKPYDTERITPRLIWLRREILRRWETITKHENRFAVGHSGFRVMRDAVTNAADAHCVDDAVEMFPSLGSRETGESEAEGWDPIALGESGKDAPLWTTHLVLDYLWFLFLSLFISDDIQISSALPSSCPVLKVWNWQV